MKKKRIMNEELKALKFLEEEERRLEILDAFGEEAQRCLNDFGISREQFLGYVRRYLGGKVVKSKEGKKAVKAFKEWMKTGLTYPDKLIRSVVKEYLAASKESFYSF